MGKELTHKQSNEVVKLSRQEALEQVEQAVCLLEESRPVLEVDTYPKEEEELGYSLNSVLITLSMPGIILGFGVLQNLPFALVSTVVASIGATQMFIHSKLVKKIKEAKPITGMWKHLSYIYATKRQRDIAKKRAYAFPLHRDSKKLYSVLIERVNEELTQNGVFEVLNDLSNPENQRFVSLNMSTGEFEYVTRKELEMSQQKELVIVDKHKVVQNSLVEKLTDKEPLLKYST